MIRIGVEPTEKRGKKLCGPMVWRCTNRGIVEKGSTIYCGHWHTSWGHERDGNGSEWGSDAVFLPYVKEGIVALDGCTSHSGFVNVVVVEI